MRIIVPFAGRVHPITRAALRDLAPEAEFVDVSGDLFAYGRLLGRVWADGESFLLLEHDIEVTPRALEEAQTCDRLWCTSPYRYRWLAYEFMLTSALGCARFRGDLLKAHPEVMDRVNDMSNAPEFVYAGGVVDAAPWWLIDGRLNAVLRSVVPPHQHSEVGHHHWNQHTPESGQCHCGSRTLRLCAAGRHHADDCRCRTPLWAKPPEPAVISSQERERRAQAERSVYAAVSGPLMGNGMVRDQRGSAPSRPRRPPTDTGTRPRQR